MCTLQPEARTIKYHVVQINFHAGRNLNPICGLSDRAGGRQISRVNIAKRLNNLVAIWRRARGGNRARLAPHQAPASLRTAATAPPIRLPRVIFPVPPANLKLLHFPPTACLWPLTNPKCFCFTTERNVQWPRPLPKRQTSRCRRDTIAPRTKLLTCSQSLKFRSTSFPLRAADKK